MTDKGSVGIAGGSWSKSVGGRGEKWGLWSKRERRHGSKRGGGGGGGG